MASMIRLFSTLTHIGWVRPIALVTGLSTGLFGLEVGANATLDLEQVPAAGSHSTMMRVSAPGYYTVDADSSSGVQIRLRSKVTGPGPWVGLVGSEDGRLDGLLDAGVYQVDVRGHVTAADTVSLTTAHVKPRAEATVALSTTVASTTLADRQAVSFWLDVETDGPVPLEFAGRALADVRIWRHGNWLMRDQRQATTRESAPGEPLRVVELSADLKAGRYRVTAYGGPALAWTSGAKDSPLFARAGFRTLGPAHRDVHTASPFGVDRFLVPRHADLFRLSLPIPDAATIRVQRFNAAQPFRVGGKRADVLKESRVPSAEVRGSPVGTVTPLAGKQQFDLVTVTRQAAQSYTLQVARLSQRIVLNNPGDYWVQSIAVGAARDQFPITALAFAGKQSERRHRLSQSQALVLDHDSHWRRQFNLVGQSELFLHVQEPGTYQFKGSGSSAQYSLAPYGRPKQGEPKARKPDAHGVLELARGYFRLTLQAPEAGVHELHILGTDASPEPRLLPGAALFERLHVTKKHQAVVSVAAAASAVGVVARRLPIDMRIPFQLTVAPGQRLSVPVQITQPGQLRFSHVTPDDYTLALAGGSGQSTLPLTPGVHQIVIRSAAVAPRTIGLRFDPTVVDTTPKSAPVTRTLRLQQPERISVRSEAPVRLRLNVLESGLYALESQGLLALKARLHSQTSPNLSVAEQNGRGRNFHLLQYLQPGQYELEVAAIGRSSGEAIVTATRAAQRAVEVLHPATVTAHDMAPGQGVSMPVEVPVAGKYQLRAMGLSRRFPVRFTDADGWPLARPGVAGDLTLDLQRGTHQLDVFPALSSARLVSDLHPIPSLQERTGHGPHKLPTGFNHDVRLSQHRWYQGAPDIWTFEIRARGSFELRLSNGMAGTVIDQAGRVVAEVDAGRNWTGELPVGAYAWRVAHPRAANRTLYAIAATSQELLPGMRHAVKTPAILPLSIPPGQAIELSSIGDADVSALLRGPSGKVLARSDDTASNWNFGIKGNFPGGKYHLAVTSMTGKAVDTVVEYRSADVSTRSGTRVAPSSLTVESVHTPARVAPDKPLTINIEAPAALLTVRSSAEPVQILSENFRGTAVNAMAAVGWNNEPGGVSLALRATGRSTVAADVSLMRLQPELKTIAPGGTYEVLARSSVQLRVSNSTKRWSLDLPPHLYAILGADTVGGAVAKRWVLDSDADTIIFANVSDQRSFARASSRAIYLSRDQGSQGLEHFATLEAATAGRWRVHTGAAKAKDTEINVAGPVRHLWTGNAKGWREISSRRAPALDWADIEHGPGRLTLWFASQQSHPWRDATETAWSGDSNSPLSLSLTPAGATLALPGREPALLEVQSESAVGVRIASTTVSSEIVADRGYLVRPEGAVSVSMKPVDGAGAVTLYQRSPSVLSEGLSAPVWLPAQAATLFSFDLTHAVEVGVGARGEQDRISTTLLDAAGLHLREGAVVQQQLKPGKYLLLIQNDAESPQLVRAALVGTERPEGTPARVVKNYLQRAGFTSDR